LKNSTVPTGTTTIKFFILLFIFILYYLAFFPMTVITPRLTALALYRKPSLYWSVKLQCNAPPPFPWCISPHLIMIMIMATCLH